MAVQLSTPCMYMATKGLKYPGSYIGLVRSLKEDLRLWNSFLGIFNGHSMW